MSVMGLIMKGKKIKVCYGTWCQEVESRTFKRACSRSAHFGVGLTPSSVMSYTGAQ